MTSSPPWLPVSTPSTSLDEYFFFNSLVVGLPYSLIFWQFWFFFVFKLVVVLLSVVQGSKAFCTYASILAEVLLFINKKIFPFNRLDLNFLNYFYYWYHNRCLPVPALTVSTLLPSPHCFLCPWALHTYTLSNFFQSPCPLSSESYQSVHVFMPLVLFCLSVYFVH